MCVCASLPFWCRVPLCRSIRIQMCICMHRYCVLQRNDVPICVFVFSFCAVFLCLHVFVFIRVFVYVDIARLQRDYAQLCTRIRTCICIFIDAHVHLYIYVHSHVHVCLHMHVHSHICLNIYVHLHIYVCMHVLDYI